ncbi:MAG TPA: SUMF1/EgtB/PvdO family nonheme iron enzyme [Phycisphaerales bacterium]|nr:SUMF1/EgtB/PvdO family nonheme iron enzyme [Phycisphaerales bacterium]
MNKPLALGVLVSAVLGQGVLGQAAPPNYDFQWQTIGSPGNTAYHGPDLGGVVTGRGSVPYVYRMARLEVTSTQWVEFANVIGAIGDPFRIGEDALGGFEGGVTGPNNTYHYSIQGGFPGIGQYPVSRIPWLNGARYCNWLQNGKQASLVALENGAYDLRAYNADPTSANAGLIHREPGAQFWIPSIDEWVKAGHFDPNGNGPGQAKWWQYPITSDTAPVSGVSPLFGGTGQTNAALYATNPNTPYQTLLAGAYPAVQSPWGLLDLSGGVSELLEDRGVFDSVRYADGSTLYLTDVSTDRVDQFADVGIAGSPYWFGLRIASAIPTPHTFCGCIVAIALAHTRRRRSCRDSSPPSCARSSG